MIPSNEYIIGFVVGFPLGFLVSSIIINLSVCARCKK